MDELTTEQEEWIKWRAEQELILEHEKSELLKREYTVEQRDELLDQISLELESEAMALIEFEKQLIKEKRYYNRKVQELELECAKLKLKLSQCTCNESPKKSIFRSESVSQEHFINRNEINIIHSKRPSVNSNTSEQRNSLSFQPCSKATYTSANKGSFGEKKLVKNLPDQYECKLTDENCNFQSQPNTGKKNNIFDLVDQEYVTNKIKRLSSRLSKLILPLYMTDL